MSTYKSTSEPEIIPQVPVVINGVEFNPSKCIHGPEVGEHTCVHDWRVYWGNQPRAQ